VWGSCASNNSWFSYVWAKLLVGRPSFLSVGAESWLGVECFGEEAVFNPVRWHPLDRGEFTVQIMAI
jgi:hypothetical protein